MVELVTLDLSYISLTEAVPQLERVELAAGADLVALVKPMFELHLPKPPEDEASFALALQRAVEGIGQAGWEIVETAPSPVRGARGAFELFVHARRPS